MSIANLLKSRIHRRKSMKQNIFPNKIPLIVITIVSTLLAIPGGYGSIFLLDIGFDFAKDFSIFGLLVVLPPIIGFSLLYGYYWTLFHQRITKWFWIVSFLFNLMITISSIIFLVSISDKKITPIGSLIFLFPLWTAFVVYVSYCFIYHERLLIPTNLP